MYSLFIIIRHFIYIKLAESQPYLKECEELGRIIYSGRSVTDICPLFIHYHDG